MNDEESAVAPRRRAPADGVRVSREAARLVRPINERVGTWQAESIRLQTAARRMKASGRHDPGIVESIRTLLEFVEEQARQFEALIATVEKDIGAHSRVADTRRVLQMVADRMRACL